MDMTMHIISMIKCCIRDFETGGRFCKAEESAGGKGHQGYKVPPHQAPSQPAGEALSNHLDLFNVSHQRPWEIKYVLEGTMPLSNH